MRENLQESVRLFLHIRFELSLSQPYELGLSV